MFSFQYFSALRLFCFLFFFSSPPSGPVAPCHEQPEGSMKAGRRGYPARSGVGWLLAKCCCCSCKGRWGRGGVEVGRSGCPRGSGPGAQWEPRAAAPPRERVQEKERRSGRDPQSRGSRTPPGQPEPPEHATGRGHREGEG